MRLGPDVQHIFLGFVDQGLGGVMRIRVLVQIAAAGVGFLVLYEAVFGLQHVRVHE